MPIMAAEMDAVVLQLIGFGLEVFMPARSDLLLPLLVPVSLTSQNESRYSLAYSFPTTLLYTTTEE